MTPTVPIGSRDASKSHQRTYTHQSTPSADDIRVELERILSNPDFQASKKRCAFLRFIVEEALSGRADQLKGYTVAIAVFERDETFDSQADPVVRLEARRLRRDLDTYYVDAGRHDPVRISIPKGSYVPHFEWREGIPPSAYSEEEPEANSDAPPMNNAAGGSADIVAAGSVLFRYLPSRNLLGVALLVAVAVITAAAWFVLAGKRSVLPASDDSIKEPAVVVLPFEALSPSENSRYLAEGIRQELINDLMRFPGFRLYTLPFGFNDDVGSQLDKLGRSIDVAYAVNGSVRIDNKEVRVAAQMFDAATGRVLWAEEYQRDLVPEALMTLQGELAGEIAATLGQPYGIVNRDLVARQKTAAVSDMQSYVCVLRAFSYRRSFSREEFGPVLGCLEEAVKRDPLYSDAWAMLGWLYLDAGRYQFSGGNAQDHYGKAFQAASRALTLAPNDTLALKALSAINHYMGRYDESERLARQAAELNPHDPDTLAQLGWRLAVRGKFDEGIPVLKRAIERTVNPPGWYFHLVAVDLYLQGDYGQMLQIAERSAVDGSDFSQALIAIAAAALGDGETAQRALEKIEKSGVFANDPAAYFHRHGATDEISNALMAGLREARRIASGS